MAIKTRRILNVERPGRVRGGWKAGGNMSRLLCLINVMSVREVSLATEALLNTKKSTLVRNPISVTPVEKASPGPHTLFNTRGATSEKKFYHSDPRHTWQGGCSFLIEPKPRAALPDHRNWAGLY